MRSSMWMPKPIITWSNVRGGYTGTGNISQDPKFTGSGDFPYRLDQDSPCIDAGDPSITTREVGEADFSGQNRMVVYH